MAAPEGLSFVPAIGYGSRIVRLAQEGERVDDQGYHRRRESDRAQERAKRAQERGDHAAYLMAQSKVEAALRRRAEWAGSGSGER